MSSPVVVFRNPLTGTRWSASGANASLLAAWGWEVIEGPDPAPADPFPQYLTESDAVDLVNAGTGPLPVALSTASVAALEDADAVELGGAWDFAQVPTVAGVAIGTGSGSSVPDATSTTKGIVQLAGDLAGTAAAPTVPGLAGKAPSTRAITAGTGLSGGGDLSADRTLTVAYGSTAGTAVQGNDVRVTADQAAATASIRTLGTGPQQAASGAHTHSDPFVYPQRHWDPATSTWSSRPLVPAGVVVTAYSSLYPAATPPAGASSQDVWMLAKTSAYWPA